MKNISFYMISIIAIILSIIAIWIVLAGHFPRNGGLPGTGKVGTIGDIEAHERGRTRQCVHISGVA